jgi:hypothetical protein
LCEQCKTGNKNKELRLQDRSNIHKEKVGDRWSTKRGEAAARENGNTNHDGKSIREKVPHSKLSL